MKTCRSCNVAKPLSEFYRHAQMADGYLNCCKDCKKAAQHEYAARNADRLRAYERARWADPIRRMKAAAYTRRHRANHPERAAARAAVARALQGGRLTRQPCQVCGSTRVQAHHHDYAKPLDVEWFCFKHHREVAHGQRVA